MGFPSSFLSEPRVDGGAKRWMTFEGTVQQHTHPKLNLAYEPVDDASGAPPFERTWTNMLHMLVVGTSAPSSSLSSSDAEP